MNPESSEFLQLTQQCARGLLQLFNAKANLRFRGRSVSCHSIINVSAFALKVLVSRDRFKLEHTPTALYGITPETPNVEVNCRQGLRVSDCICERTYSVILEMLPHLNRPCKEGAEEGAEESTTSIFITNLTCIAVYVDSNLVAKDVSRTDTKRHNDQAF